MSTSKGEVSFLESFPLDIWAYFARCLPGEQLGRLMMTGATLLRQRLKSPNVVKSINIGEDFLIFKSFPKCFSELPSVEELSIGSYNEEWSDSLGLKLASIPSSVRKLELGGSWSSASEIALFGGGSTLLKLDEHLPRLEYLALPFDGWNSPPSSLTTLKIGFWGGDVELPPTLIHFEATCVTVEADSAIAKIPAALESFLVVNCGGADLLVPLLPASIRQLSLGFPNPAFSSSPADTTPDQIAKSALERLPPSLVTLHTGEPLFNFQLYPELIPLLPSTLTELDLTTAVPCSMWPLLPPQLKKASFLGEENHCVVVTEMEGSSIKIVPFERLPRSLTSLTFSGELYSQYFCAAPATLHQSTSDAPDQSYFPPHLTYLSIYCIQLSPEAAQLLPSSLTHLEIGNFSEQICEHLPNGLETLISNRTLLSPKLIKHLPKSLTSLEFAFSNYKRFDHRTGSLISGLSDLPEYTTHCDCVSKSFDWKDHASLPPQLTSLVLSQFDQIGDSFLLHHRLANLQKLILGESKWISDLSIPLLSPQLTSLDLTYASAISGKSFPSLPRGLTFLLLTSSVSIFDSDIQHLPRTLKYVDLQQAKHLTDACIPDLPPHLETLMIQANEKISPASLPLFPYSIRTCCRYNQSARFSKWSILGGRVKLG